MITQRQADQATRICDRMLETIAKLQHDLDAMKTARDEWEAKMALDEERERP